jgi:hypothetical protein
VEVSFFFRARHHALANDVEIVALEKIPAVIRTTPDIVLGIADIDDVRGVLCDGRRCKKRKKR